METPFYSKDFHRHLPIDLSLRGAREMEAEGELERWISEYLTCDPRWANPGLVNGLRTKPHRIHGLMALPIGKLERKCGPEPEMEFWQDRESFERHIRAIEESLEALADLPPLIVEDLGGRLVVCDGTHRLEAIRRKGWAACWAVVFSKE
jgi:hypothetical protein